MHCAAQAGVGLLNRFEERGQVVLNQGIERGFHRLVTVIASDGQKFVDAFIANF